MMNPGLLSLFGALTLPLAAIGNVPPEAPAIIEPAAGSEVSGEDVHMVTGPFFDADGDAHLCTDWEIVDLGSGETAWSAPCATGFLRSHIHLGDGGFAPPLVSERRLKSSRQYMLRVRYRDSSGNVLWEWSAWSEHLFRTSRIQRVAPMIVADVLMTLHPRWLDPSDEDIVLPAGSQSSLLLETSSGLQLLEIRALDGALNQWLDSNPISEHQPLRVTIENGPNEKLLLPESRLMFRSEEGDDLAIYLPDAVLDPSAAQSFWISSNGSSHFGGPTQMNPDFSRIARGNPVPWLLGEDGYVVEMVAGGFQLPVAIEFVSDPGDDPDDPLFYVGELYGTVKVVSRDGTVSTYAADLLNFDPFGNFPGAGERGLADIAVEPETGDLFVTLPYHPEGEWGGVFYPRVMRLISSDDGRKMERSENVLDLVGALIGPSHQISSVTIGPDDKLYVHLADGNCIPCARDLASALGKILRLELDGLPASDNPYYDATDGISVVDYVYALGFRNPFGGAWRAADQHLYEVENGPSTDRFARVEPGVDYGWSGKDEDMSRGALFTWRGGAAAPVNVAFIQMETFSGSGFPWWKQDIAYVTESGPTWATGRPASGKRIGEFVITEAGALGGKRRTFVEYDGSGKATVAALAAGPDGLYFSDLYSDEDLDSPVASGARIFRIRHVGSASFEANYQPNDNGCGSIQFRDRSTARNIEAWRWRFGDGRESTQQNPIHHYERCGVHPVELTVTGDAGDLTRTVVIDVQGHEGSGLWGEYFRDDSLRDMEFRRLDPSVDFSWTESPLGDDAEFSVRWRGSIRARISQPHHFRFEGASGVLLWINGQPVIDDWEGDDSVEKRGRFEMEAGRAAAIRIEIRSSRPDPTVRLIWSSESQQEEVIPTESLYPDLGSRRRAVRPK